MVTASTAPSEVSILWEDKQSLHPLSTQYTLYLSQATKPSGLSASLFFPNPDSFSPWYWSLHLQKMTAGSLFYATIRLTSENIIFTLLAS